APKVTGASNLARELAKGPPVDFVVLYSSVAGVLGGGGQTTYAAANAALDAIAYEQSGRGERWVSIAWGAWSEVGMASRLSSAYAFETTIAPEQGVELLGRILSAGVSHAIVYPGSFRHWKQANTSRARISLLPKVSAT